MSTPPAMLHPELLAADDTHAIARDGRRLDHAEGAFKPLRSRPEPEPRGAKVHGHRPIDQVEAAARFIAAPEHEKMHDERLWDLRQKRDREMLGIAEWEELRALASARGSVDRFFDAVLVMADDPALRANRLALLRALAAAMNQVADISKL